MRKTIKIRIALILVFCFTMIQAVTVMAASKTISVTTNHVVATAYTYDGAWHNTLIKHMDNDDKTALYCMYYSKSYATADYTKSDFEKSNKNFHEALGYVLSHGLNKVGKKAKDSDYSLKNSSDDYAITQLAVWGVIYKYSESSDYQGVKLEDVSIVDGYDSKILTKAKKLRDDAIAYASDISGSSPYAGYGTNPKITIKSPANLYLSEQSDGSYKSGKYTFAFSGMGKDHLQSLSVTLGSDAPQGTAIKWVDSSNKKKGFYVTMTKAGYEAFANGITEPKEAEWSIDAVAKFKAADAYTLHYSDTVQPLVYLKWEELPNGNPTHAQAKVKAQPTRRHGSVYIRKQNPDGEDLSKVTFSVYSFQKSTNAYDKFVGKMIYNDRTNQYEIENLQCYDKTGDPYINNGKFEIRETTAEPGHINDKWKKTFTIDPNGAIEQYFTIDASKNIVSVASKPEGNAGILVNVENEVKIRKVDEDNNVVKEAVFQYGPSKNNEDLTTKTTVNGILTLKKLKSGLWFYRESDVTGEARTKGFKANMTWHTFNVDSDGYITKQDGVAIPGGKTNSATFTEINYISTPVDVTKQDTKKQTLNTEEYRKYWQGGAERTGFPNGTKFGVYEWDATTSSYKSGLYATLVWNTAKGYFVNASTGEKALLQRRTKTIGTSHANNGKYKIVELTATPGYSLDPSVKEVEVTANGTISGDTTFTDEPNQIQIIKYNSDTDNPTLINDAEFDIWYGSSTTNNPDYFRIVTGKDNTGAGGESGEGTGVNGMAFFTHLKPGTWHIQEKAAPDGYAIDNTVYDLIVNSDGTFSNGTNSMSFTIKDGKEVTVLIAKKDAETGDVYSFEQERYGFPKGTEFDIYEWDEDLGDYRTDSSKHIIFKEED